MVTKEWLEGEENQFKDKYLTIDCFIFKRVYRKLFITTPACLLVWNVYIIYIFIKKNKKHFKFVYYLYIFFLKVIGLKTTPYL